MALLTESTTFTKDVLGRYICSTFDEATADPEGIDVVVIGGGMYGGYCAAKIYQESQLRLRGGRKDLQSRRPRSWTVRPERTYSGRSRSWFFRPLWPRPGKCAIGHEPGNPQRGLGRRLARFLSRCARSMKSSVAVRNSSSTVSMRFLVSGPVSVQLCLPHLPKQDAARKTEAQLELRALRVVGVLRLILRVEVIEVAEKLVEAMNGRQELIAVAEMILAELSGHIALRLEQFGERRVLVRQPFLSARQPDLQKAGAHRALAGDERGASGGRR